MSSESDAAAWRTFKAFCLRWLRATFVFAAVGCVAGITAFFLFLGRVPTGYPSNPYTFWDKLEGAHVALMMYTLMPLYDMLDVLGLNGVIDFSFKGSGFDFAGLLLAASSHAAAGFMIGGALYPVFRLGILLGCFTARALGERQSNLKTTRSHVSRI